MNWMPAASINGRIQYSNNKPNTPYKDLAGTYAEELSFDEAARWLLFYNSFSDCTVGKQQYFSDSYGVRQKANAQRTFPSKGALISPVGNNLFETIILNSVLFEPNRRELYKSIHPVWEDGDAYSEMIIKKPVPNDLPRMYTQQARRILLYRKESKIIGAFVSAGEDFDVEDQWMEPAFMMHEVKDKNTKKIITVPMQCRNGIDIWREIEHIAGDKGASITKWVSILEDEEIFPEDRVIPFRVTGISYGSSSCSIQSMVEDRILLCRQFLKDSVIQSDAVNEIERIDRIAKVVKSFGNNCAKCMNLSDRDTRIGGDLSEKFYAIIGHEFRKYLSGKTTIESLRKSEIIYAKDIVALFIKQNIKILLRGKPGERGMYLGKAEALFYSKLSKLERE